MDHDHHHPQNPNPCDTHFSDNFDALPEFDVFDDHHHPQNPNPCDTHFSDNFDALPEFDVFDFLLPDDGSEEGFSPENMAFSDNVIDGSIESVGVSSSTQSNIIHCYATISETQCLSRVHTTQKLKFFFCALIRCRNKNGARKRKADQAGSRVAFRTKSDLEVMDDGFQWRKYGKKMVKNSPYPRNYYKCARGGCNVKKRVERDGEDPSYVITTYDGMHNHESPCVVYYNQPPLVVPNGWTLQPPPSSAQSSPSASHYNQEGTLSMEELVDKLGEVEDEESLNDVTESFYLLGELEETPSDPRESEELNCDPMEVTPTIISHHFSILHVLDLSYTEIKSLPQSISRLVALQKLFLRSCELLMELPPEIGELANLEVLDLEGTEILRLPKEIAKLVNLTCLKVSFYGYANQTVIPRRVLSYLSSLIELIIDVTLGCRSRSYCG
ncbi:uncharacterized protein LOC131303113 [Rhododendron vialii]|uniref:uncharacterized protein LOC131303113 n=1 Tax=Rhododendron vialii TaxID=182163 RepID=UPI00265E5453|nr:uncharacterized protein LOC131303113 [Rhododendron vialii]